MPYNSGQRSALASAYALGVRSKMKTIYELSEDRKHVANVQKATLTTEDFGIQQTHGLFGSKDWWAQIAEGKLEKKAISGVVSRVYMGSMNDWPEFTIRKDNGEEENFSRYANNPTLGKEYKKGRRIEIDYVIQKHKKSYNGESLDTKCVIEIRIQTRPNKSVVTTPEAAPPAS